MEQLQELTFVIILALQQMSPALDGVMNFFTFLARIEFYLLIIPVIYWVVDKRLGYRLLLILVTTDIFASTLKLLFHQPRPYWLGRVMELSEQTSYGIPSSHASDSLAVWGDASFLFNIELAVSCLYSEFLQRKLVAESWRPGNCRDELRSSTTTRS